MHRTPMDAGVPGGDAAPTVIVTRPQPQADAWVARLQALGQAAVAFPLLAIADCADPGAVALAWRGLSGHALVMFVKIGRASCRERVSSPV